jgi:hypothetical protein
VLGAPKPLVQRIRTPWSIRSWLKKGDWEDEKSIYLVNLRCKLTMQGRRTVAAHVKNKGSSTILDEMQLTVNPKGIRAPSTNSSTLCIFDSINVLIHSTQKSNNFWPSSCFCSSVSRYFDCVISNFPSPLRVTRQTRRFVPPNKLD